MFKKRIGISQKVMKHPRYDEVMDCLDTQWSNLMIEMDFQPVPLPNVEPQYVGKLIENLDLDGIILSGGNTLCSHASADDAPEDLSEKRDVFEFELIRQALKQDKPLLGVCRGLQTVNVFFGGDLKRITGHVGRTLHDLISLDKNSDFEFPKQVNSFHDLAVDKDQMGEGLIALATDKDGNVEALRHAKYQVFAIMWHPERQEQFSEYDLKFIKGIFLS